MGLDKFDSLAVIAAAMQSTIRSYEKIGVKRWDASIALTDLSYQASGLLKLKMLLDNERRSETLTREQILGQIEIELAEVVGLCGFIADQLGLDIPKGFRFMLESDASKTSSKSRIPANEE